MKTHTVTEQDVRDAWMGMPAPFRETHPVPQTATYEAGQAWSATVREDCAAVIVVTLDAATAALARGDVAGSQVVAAEVRPFQRLKRTLDAVEAQQGREGDPLDRPCDECGADPGEACRPACTAQG